jgi:hypothetical protein
VITLTFRALSNDSMIFVRGTYFRICADATLRGPDNAVAANYTDGLWHVARKQHRVLECRAAVYLRVTTPDGRRKSIGPYEHLKVTGGEIFSNDTYLGAHTRKESRLPQIDLWSEIALLSDG